MDADLKLLKQAALVVAAALAITVPGHAQPQLLVSSASVILNDNQARSIQVTASGTPSESYTLSGVPLWLSTFSANNFTTPDTLYIQLANTSCGTCMATITLTPASGAPVTVTVTYAPGSTGGAGTLLASPSSLTFTAAPGQGGGSQTVTLSTTSATSIFIAGIASDQTSWLSASITSGSFAVNANSSATLTVSTTALNLANGSYTGHITITPSIGTAVTITVTFNVGSGSSSGTIVATPASLTFNIASGQIAAAQNVSLTTASVSAVTIVGINPDVSWLSFSITSGSALVSAGSPATFSVAASASGLANGTYVGHINILPSIGSATVITITLNVGAGTGSGTITASQTSFQFAYPGNTLSAPVTIGSSNLAVGSFNLNVTSQSNWLIFQGITGSFTGLAFGTYTISVNAAVASTLPTGTYSGVITLINPQNASDTTAINLSLTVNGGTGGALAVTPTTLSFTASPGGAPQSQNLTVTVPANASVLLNITSNNGPFFSIASPGCNGSPNVSFSCTFTGTEVLTLTVNPGSLSTLGMYTGSLMFQSGGSTVTVPLTLNLTAAVAALTATPTALSFTAAAGSSPQTEVVVVSVPGNASVQASLTSYNGNFFSVNSSNCNANPVTNPTCTFSGSQPLSVTVNPAVLTSTGVYNGNIQMQSGGITVNVTVTLTLTSSGGGATSAIAAPAALAFAYQVNSSVSVPQQVITVGSVGAFSATQTVSTTQQWLNISNVGSVGPGYVIASVNPQGLAAGTYAGAISINSASGNATIPVTLTVAAGIVVDSAPATVNIPYQTGAPPVAQTLTLFASDNSATPVNASSSTPWITVQSQSATTTPATVQLAINPSGLCNGLNTGSVTISAPNAANGGFTIPVVALVTGSTTAGCPGTSTGPLMLVPPAMLFTAQANGPLPASQILQVFAPTPSTSYIVSAALPLPSGVINFLTVQPNGILTGNQLLTVSVNQTGLAPGTYTLPIALNTNGAMQNVPVTLVVGQPGGLIGGLTPNPSNLLFSAQSGQSAGSQNVALTNTTANTISILSVSTDSPNFLSAAVTAGPFTVTPGAPPTTVTVTATAARLPVGTVVGHITVNTSAGSIQITATVVVTSASVPGSIVANPASLTFSATAGQTAAAQTVSLAPSSSGPVTLSAPTTDVSWLSVSVNTLTVSPGSPGILTVVANAASLQTGFYVGHITISPAPTPLATSPTIIGVTFLVPPPNSGGTITASQTSLQFVYPGNTSSLVAVGTSNPSIANFNVAVASQPNWLLFGNNPSGTYFGLQFGSYLVRVDPSVAGNLPAGSYTGSITLINPQNPSDITTVTVSLIVAGGTNLAQGKTATQSSTLPGYPTAGAASAVDGNTDGNFFDGSVTATNLDPNPWWEVDLGATVTVNSVLVWNRTDCCGSRLSDYWVFLSNTPFLPTDTPANLQFQAGTQALHLFNAATPPGANIFGNVQARYVRVQLSNAGYLSLAEVQVFGISAPLISNVALGKTATQSSTLPGYPTAGAGAAVDGNTDGSFFDGSVTATNLDPFPWWQVDLGSSQIVGSINIWNRTDCCGSRLGDYWVFVSDTPFLPTDTPATLQFRAGTFSIHETSAPNPSTIIAPVAQGRYVRVQLSGPSYLSLAEVQVYGVPAPAAADLALGMPATQSSTLPGFPTALASAAVDGSTDGVFYDGSVTATNLDPNPWWQVDLGAPHTVNTVAVWNRTDCCSSRLGDYWVFVSDTPFLPSDTPATLANRAGTFSSHQTTAPNPSTPIPVGVQGQYVRVQLSSSNYLSLAEVQVIGQ